MAPQPFCEPASVVDELDPLRPVACERPVLHIRRVVPRSLLLSVTAFSVYRSVVNSTAILLTAVIVPGMIPAVAYVSPLLLTFGPDPDLMDSLATSLMLGEPVFSWLPLISTVVLCIAFISVAIRRFNRQELCAYWHQKGNVVVTVEHWNDQFRSCPCT